MKTQIGMWIDHRKAVVVALTGNGDETTQVIESTVERQPGRSRGHCSSAHQAPADDRRLNRITEQLDSYYDAVIAAVRNAERLLIFGPGEAKGELRRRMLNVGLPGCIEETETVDKMTDRQIAAKVRQHFLEVCAP